MTMRTALRTWGMDTNRDEHWSARAACRGKNPDFWVLGRSARTRAAVAMLGWDSLSGLERDAARLRLDYPDASLTGLAELSEPKWSKDGVGSALRRLLARAARPS